MEITYKTTQSEFEAIQIAKFKELYPKKRITARILEMFKNGHTVDGKLFAHIVRDTFETMDLHKSGKDLKQIFSEFTKAYDVCPPENKFSLYVGFKYFLTQREGNIFTAEYLYRNEPFFNDCIALLAKFNTNNKNEYKPFIFES